MLRLLLLIGGGCDAFLGGHIHKRTASLPGTALWYSQNPSSTNSSSLLQGKVTILQDVVKEMDARHQELLEESTKAKEEYTQKLEDLQKDLAESKTAKGDHQSAIEKLESTLEETIEQHAKDLDELQQTKDQQHEQETQQLKIQNEEEMEKLRNAFEEHVQDLEMKLDAQSSQVQELSAKLLQNSLTEIEDTEKDATIEELQKQIKAQTEQLESIQTEQSQEENDKVGSDKPESTSETSVIASLKAEHQEAVEDYKGQLDALSKEKQKLSSELAQMDESYKAKLDDFCDDRNQKLSELEAKHQWVVEDYESRLDAIFAEKEEVSKDLQTSHQEIIADYETKLQEANAQNDKLSSELTTVQAIVEEQVAIAEASVKAGQAREADLQDERSVLLKRVQMYWIAAKLTNVLATQTEQELAALWKERDQLESENEDLCEELETTKKGVQDLIEQLENQNTLWDKLRSKVTGK